MKANSAMRRAGAWCATAAKRFWTVLSRRFWMKMLSLLLAILLWNYVISANNSITRTKTIYGVNGYLTGQSTLNTYGLALLTDPSEEIDDVTVRVEVAQSQYVQASPENVQVMLDVSSVRTSGTQAVPLKAVSTFGRVVGILPETVTLTFETLDSRLIPVNVEMTGERDGAYWYSVQRTNPSAITVSGAASVVQNVTQARVFSDVTGMNSSYVRAEPFVLLDDAGEEVAQSMLTRSASSISVSTDVYPTKELPLSTEIENVVLGKPAEGYVVSEITAQPEVITVAAEQSLLDGVSELLVEPVSVEGFNQSFSARAGISLLSDFKFASTEQVYLNITITEEEVSEWISNNVMTFVGKAESMRLEWKKDAVQVKVTGPRSAVEALMRDGVPIIVDLTNLEAGSHSCPLQFPTDSYPNVRFEPEISEINITLTETPEE